MSFDTITFLFVFLPICIVAYFLSPRAARNLVLIFFSLLFVGWSEPYWGAFVFILVLAIGNYLFGRLIELSQHKALKGTILFLGLCLNVAILIFFKYADFFADQVNILQSFNIQDNDLNLLHDHPPIGLSFVVFTMLAYLLDVYSGLSSSEKNPLHFGLFTIFFPKMIAGPIVRYRELEGQFKSRVFLREEVVVGIQRFVIGLTKKTLIANNVGEVADQIFALKPTDLGTGLAWLGIVCYTIQIYFDFSAYSDMAIGLGAIFGFNIPENFDYPYTATSIIDFWRRWHITLSNWLRDYIFLPLSRFLLRRSSARILIMATASLTTMLISGLWHGVGWNFVVWGLIHGALMFIERVWLGAWLRKRNLVIGHFYALMSIMLTWVIFRTATLKAALDYLTIMFIPQKANDLYNVRLFLDNENLAALLLGILFSIPIAKWIEAWIATLHLEERAVPFFLYRSAGLLMLSTLFILAVMGIFSGSYQPFLYFRF